MSSNEDDRYSAAYAPRGGGELIAPHFWHGVIDDHQRDRIWTAQRAQSSINRTARGDVVSCRREHSANRSAHLWIVIKQQHRSPWNGNRRCRLNGFRVGHSACQAMRRLKARQEREEAERQAERQAEAERARQEAERVQKAK